MTEYVRTHKSWILSLFLAALLAAGVWVLIGATRGDNDLDSSNLNAFCGPGHANRDHHLRHHHRRHHANNWHRRHPNRGHHLGHHHRRHHRNCPPPPGPNEPLPPATPTPTPSDTVTPTPTPTPTPSCTQVPGGYGQPPETICTTPSP